ncbi:MAG: tRNA lysidine(34) synthetase TilS [Thiomicrospira sp.]
MEALARVYSAISDFYAQHHCDTLWVAYSGGLDSTVLLDALVQLRPTHRSIKAIHIHHGLQAHADEWVEHCQRQCQCLGVELVVVRVALKGDSNIEARARNARYQAFAQQLGPHDGICTAHHQRDQAETFCLNLLRGAGVNGLAAMPPQRRLNNTHPAWLYRPLLGLTRADLQAYAACHQLSWVEDVMNRDMRFQRSVVRHKLLPLMAEIWPQAETKIAESAAHLAEARDLLAQLAQLDLSQISHNAQRIDWRALQALSWSRQKLVLRHWLHHYHGISLDQACLNWLKTQCFTAAPDRQPIRRLGHGQLRRYRQFLYFLHNEPANYRIRLAGHDELSRYGLQAQLSEGEGLALAWFEAGHQVYLRNISAAERTCAGLKNWFAQQAIPPWQRTFWPVIEVDGELALIVGYRVMKNFAAKEGEVALKVSAFIEAQHLLG